MPGEDSKARAGPRQTGSGPDEERRRESSFSDRVATDPSAKAADGEAVSTADASVDDESGRITDPSTPNLSKKPTSSGPHRSATIERQPRVQVSRTEAVPTGEESSVHREPAPPACDEHVGRVFGGKYRIDKLVAKGGMGRVYRGTQFPLERPVAIKILNKEFQRSDPQFVRRFFLEAATAAKLSHPHSITVFDYGESENGDLYIAMEYLKGRPLSRVISADGPFTPDRALRISIQVCRALREAHVLGIIHRDLKPGNIFLVDEGDDSDYAKVLDFGLVKLFRPETQEDGHLGTMLGEGDPELTRTGTLLGSPKYMSPEQIQGHHLDPRTDIYSFGVILFQMIAGKPPYTGATGVDVIYKHVHHEIPAIASVAPEVDCPPAVEALIERCLAKSRDDRFASMDELITHLKDALRLVAGTSSTGDSFAEVVAALRSDGSKEPSVRKKIPATRPPSGLLASPIAAAPTASIAPEEVREAGFRDPLLVEDPTPIGHLGADRQEVSGPSRRPSRAPLAVSAVGFLVALLTLGYVTIIGPSLKRAEQATAPDAPIALPPSVASIEAEVRFTSEPSGAEVLDGETILGMTPLVRSFAVAKEGEPPHQFVFKRSGYRDATRSVHIRPDTGSIEASLDPIAVEESLDEGVPDDGDEDRAHDGKRTPAKRRRSSSPQQVKSRKDSRYRQNPY
jgi:eukaryotic-like serine/threonine-protein kinase